MKAVSDALVGSWRLVSYETRDSTGQTGRPYGAAVGRLTYDDRGQMSGQVMRPDRARAEVGVGNAQSVRAALRVLVPNVPKVLLVAGLLLGGCGDLRVKSGVYANLDEVRKAGAGGWVPEGLPSSTSDLREGHLPDGRQWGAFTFPVADAAPVRALLGTEITTGTLSCEPPGRLEFWPRVLLSPVDVERVRATGFRLYNGRDARTYAVNWGQGRAYYWRG